MQKKIKLAIFAQSRSLSNNILKKLSKLKNKIEIILVVSDSNFKNKINSIRIKKFKWLKNNKNNGKDLYAVSLQHKWKIHKKILNKFKFFFNFHFGDIPKYRGHSPIIHAILKDEKYIYGTIHAIDEYLDRGLIVGKIKVKNDNLSVKDIENKMCIKFSNYFEKLIYKLINKQKIILKKINFKKNKFYKINSLEKLKEVKNFKEIISKTRAFDYYPHEPAFIRIKDMKIYLRLKYN